MRIGVPTGRRGSNQHGHRNHHDLRTCASGMQRRLTIVQGRGYVDLFGEADGERDALKTMRRVPASTASLKFDGGTADDLVSKT
jgi:hypothetical protein